MNPVSPVPQHMHVQLTRLVSKVDEETTENARVDLRMNKPTHARSPHMATYPVDNLQSLALGNLGALQSLVQPVQRLGVEGLGAGDDDLELTPVGSHERVEVGKDLGGGGETAVLREDGEEVGEDGRGAGRNDGGEGGGALRGGEGGVFCTG